MKISCKLLNISVPLFIFGIGFLRLWNLPYLGEKLQISEIAFLGLLFSFIIARPDLSFFKSIKNYLLFGSIWISTEIISVLYNFSFSTVIESLGHIYLFLLSIILVYWLQNSNDHEKKIFKYTIIAVVVTSIFGIMGWVMTQMGIDSKLAWSQKVYYPYLGYIGRAKGFTTNPNMLASILSVVLLMMIGKKEKSHWSIYFILFLGLILTFSKSILLTFVGITAILLWQKFKNFTKLLLIGVSIFYVVFTHFLIYPTGKAPWNEIIKEQYGLDHVYKTVAKKDIVLSNYWVNKNAAFIAIKEKPILGLGPGNFNEFVGDLKSKNLYPSYFPNYQPHCTYTGALAETGTIGFLGLLAFIIFIGITLFSFGDITYSIIFWYLFVDGWVIDGLNFRHLWILIALIIYKNIQIKKNHFPNQT
jgi:hypothetical protein